MCLYERSSLKGGSGLAIEPVNIISATFIKRKSLSGKINNNKIMSKS